MKATLVPECLALYPTGTLEVQGIDRRIVGRQKINYASACEVMANQILPQKWFAANN